MMGIFERLYSIAKAEVNDRLRQAGLFSDNSYERGDLDEELRRLEEELRADENAREEARRRSSSREQQHSSTADGRSSRTSRTQRSPSAYAVIGVSPRATQDEIRDVYRQLAKKHHPDRVQRLSPNLQETARQKMKDINHAYNMINNPRKRREYDRKMGFV